MKKFVLKLRIVATIVACLAVCLMFAGCDDREDDNNNSQEFTVTFNSNGGSDVQSQTVKDGEKASKPQDPTRSEYTFDAWYKETAFTNKWDFDTDVVKSNVTLHAKWIEDESFLYNNAENPLKDEYFHIEEADFVYNHLPEGTDEIEVHVHNTVINGGSTLITVISQEELSTVYVGASGVIGYYEYNLIDYEIINNFYTYIITINISQNLLDDFIFLVSALFKSSNLSVVVQESVELKEVGTGILQISLWWDQLDDVDLHLWEPDGTEIYYGNTNSYDADWNWLGGLDLDSNAGCNQDGINNDNIVYPNTFKPGTYIAGVNLWSKCHSSTPGAIYIVTVWYEGHLLNFSNQQVGKFEDSDTNQMHIIGEFTVGSSSRASRSSLSKDDFTSIIKNRQPKEKN